MKIAIDLNDVIRDYTNNFISTYLIYYNQSFNTDDFEIWTNDMQALLEFKTERAYQKFIYEDYTYELFCKCGLCSKDLQKELREWLLSLSEYEVDEPIEVVFVSTMEYGPSLGYTLNFIGNLNSGIREIYLPKDSSTIWDRCDMLITANPYLMEIKPKGKEVVKILTDYNKDAKADYEYRKLSDFFKEEKEDFRKIINK